MGSTRAMTDAGREAEAAEAAQIAYRRRILDWRDRWSLEAEVRFADLCGREVDRIATWVAGLAIYQLATMRLGLADYVRLPELQVEAEDAAQTLVADATDDLRDVVAQPLSTGVWADHHESGPARDVIGIGAMGAGVAPFAVAGALFAALPALATTTTVTMFGLATTSVVSLPILAVGLAGVGALAGIGVVNLAGLRADQERALIAAIEAGLERRFLSVDMNDSVESPHVRFLRWIDLAAMHLIERSI